MLVFSNLGGYFYMEQNQLLQKSILFCNLKSDEIEQVLDCLGYYKKRYQKNQMIISQGESSHTIGVILSGSITICKSYMEDDLTELRTMGIYETFGHESIYTNSLVSPYTLIAKKNTEILYINGLKLIDESASNCAYRSKMNINMLKHMAQLNCTYQKHLELRSIKSLRKRVAIFLLSYNHGTQNFNIDQTREEMAEYLGATRPAVSNVLISLKEENLIDYYKNTFVIKDLEAFKKLL